ncbi:MAG: SMP-30/gluconolactonase/LRE family protein [Lentisphaeraceae bacterium]|nr:SMP-30/gluconolactonase/LRE family protein [Lentisphaeraceae bacterium]
MKKIFTLFTVLCSISLYAQDMPLSQVLLDKGGDWELVTDGYGHTDAACVDAEGNFYFSDVSKGNTINKIGPDGKVTVYAKEAERISGMQFGPNGILYACQGGSYKRIVKFDTEGKLSVLAENIIPNDLVVTHNGWVYVTETRTQKIVAISPAGKVKRFKTRAVRPNGISLSTDQSLLAVSDHGGDKVYAYRIEENGDLTFEHPYMYLRTKTPMAVAKGDGMATDAYCRYYVTSDVGIQMYDPTGRMGGVILNPWGKAVNSVVFAGPEFNYMYICAKDAIYRRKTNSTGLCFFKEPFKRKQFKKK